LFHSFALGFLGRYVLEAFLRIQVANICSALKASTISLRYHGQSTLRLRVICFFKVVEVVIGSFLLKLSLNPSVINLSGLRLLGCWFFLSVLWPYMDIEDKVLLDVLFNRDILVI